MRKVRSWAFLLKSENLWSDLKNSNEFGILDPKNRKCAQKNRGRNSNKKVKNWENSGGGCGKRWKRGFGFEKLKRNLYPWPQKPDMNFY